MRAAAAIVIGYVVNVIAVIVTLSAVWLALGPSFAYREGTLHVTPAWCLLALALGFGSAVVSGIVCGAIARSSRTVRVYAAIVFVLGVGMAVANVTREERPAEPTKPVAEMSAFEAASVSIAPPWYHFALPVIGAAGIVLGGMLARCRESDCALSDGIRS